MPQLRPSEVLVEVSHCGICGTDLHLVLERYARPGSVLGHEWAGTIAAVAADVQRLGTRRAGGSRSHARLWPLPRVHARPALGVPATRAARPPRLLPRRVLPLQGRARGAAAPRTRAPGDAGGRAHGTDCDRVALGEPRRRYVRRPCARHRRRSRRPAHRRRPAQPGGDRDRGLRARARPRGNAHSPSARRRLSHPTRSRARRWAGRWRRPSRSRSSARATRAAAESALDQLDYAGTSCSSAREARHRGSTTTASS